MSAGIDEDRLRGHLERGVLLLPFGSERSETSGVPKGATNQYLTPDLLGNDVAIQEVFNGSKWVPLESSV